MALTEVAKGVITTDGLEQTIRNETVTGLAHFATYVNLKNMAAGDVIELRAYPYDPQGADNVETYRTFTYSGVQTDKKAFIPFIPALQYKVTIKRIAGTDRSYNWVVYSS